MKKIIKVILIILFIFALPFILGILLILWANFMAFICSYLT